MEKLGHTWVAGWRFSKRQLRIEAVAVRDLADFGIVSAACALPTTV